MNIFKNRTYTWWQIGLLKVLLISIGILIGVSWYDVFLNYTNVLLIIVVLLAIYFINNSFLRK